MSAADWLQFATQIFG